MYEDEHLDAVYEGRFDLDWADEDDYTGYWDDPDEDEDE